MTSEIGYPSSSQSFRENCKEDLESRLIMLCINVCKKERNTTEIFHTEETKRTQDAKKAGFATDRLF